MKKLFVLAVALGLLAGCGTDPGATAADPSSSGVTETPDTVVDNTPTTTDTTTPVATQPTNSWATVADVPEAVKAEARAKLAEISVFLDTTAGTGGWAWNLIKDGSNVTTINIKFNDDLGRAASVSTDPDVVNMYTSGGSAKVRLFVLYKGTIEATHAWVGEQDTTKMAADSEVGYTFAFNSDSSYVGYNFDLTGKRWTADYEGNGEWVQLAAVP